jgi:hypothetical protein
MERLDFTVESRQLAVGSAASAASWRFAVGSLKAI